MWYGRKVYSRIAQRLAKVVGLVGLVQTNWGKRSMAERLKDLWATMCEGEFHRLSQCKAWLNLIDKCFCVMDCSWTSKKSGAVFSNPRKEFKD